jgi:ankyrin repeat protein
MNWNYYWATATEMEAFWKAIDTGDIKTVRRLISANPKMLRWERGDGRRPLDFYAVASKPTDAMMKFLLSLETDEFAMDSNSVESACRAGRIDTLVTLLKHGVDANGRKHDRFETPLKVAAEKGSDRIVSILLEAGADTGIESYGGVTPLEIAVKGGHALCIELLRAHPPKRRVPFHNPRRPKGKFEIDLLSDETAIRTLIKKGVKAAKVQAEPREITAIALYGSGYQGFVEIGFETGSFDPNKPDCGADVSMARVARREFPKWREPYAENNRLIVHYGGKKPANHTSRAQCARMDEPYFRFFKSILSKAIEAGDFSQLPLADNCLFGVQMHFYHHCEFWNKAGKRVGSVRF